MRARFGAKVGYVTGRPGESRPEKVCYILTEDVSPGAPQLTGIQEAENGPDRVDTIKGSSCTARYSLVG